MNNDDRIRDEVEKTLRAFDHDLPLEPNPFLFTRIQAERNRRLDRGSAGAARALGLRWIVILCLLLINLITVAHYAAWNPMHSTRQALIAELEQDFPVDDAPTDY